MQKWPKLNTLEKKMAKISHTKIKDPSFGEKGQEHRIKLHVFGNNSKTVNNIRNLTWVKMISTGRSNYPEILKKI
jgi:hypothetical protein